MVSSVWGHHHTVAASGCSLTHRYCARFATAWQAVQEGHGQKILDSLHKRQVSKHWYLRKHQAKQSTATLLVCDSMCQEGKPVYKPEDV